MKPLQSRFCLRGQPIYDLGSAMEYGNVLRTNGLTWFIFGRAPGDA